MNTPMALVSRRRCFKSARLRVGCGAGVDADDTGGADDADSGGVGDLPGVGGLDVVAGPLAAPSAAAALACLAGRMPVEDFAVVGIEPGAALEGGGTADTASAAWMGATLRFEATLDDSD